MNKTKNHTFELHKRIRRTWNINPTEQVVLSKKEYDRNTSKKEVARIIDAELDEEYADEYVPFYNDIDAEDTAG